MIRVNNDYVIETDPYNYMPMQDMHKVSVDKEGNEKSVYKNLGYYNGLDGAIHRIIEEIKVSKLKEGTISLEEAIEIIRTENEKFYELFDKATKNDRKG